MAGWAGADQTTKVKAFRSARQVAEIWQADPNWKLRLWSHDGKRRDTLKAAASGS